MKCYGFTHLTSPGFSTALSLSLSAFPSAKPGLDIPWCQAADVGLPAPDVILFMDLQIEKASLRGGFGGERYESTVFQTVVRTRFDALRLIVEAAAAGTNPATINSGSGTSGDSSPWVQVDADGTIDAIHGRLRALVDPIISRVAHSPIRALWDGAAIE